MGLSSVEDLVDLSLATHQAVKADSWSKGTSDSAESTVDFDLSSRGDLLGLGEGRRGPVAGGQFE